VDPTGGLDAAAAAAASERAAELAWILTSVLLSAAKMTPVMPLPTQRK